MTDPASAHQNLIGELAKLRAAFEGDEDFWRERLVETFLKYLRESGVEADLWGPIFAFRNEMAHDRLKPKNKKVAHLNRVLPMAAGAAAATMLKRNHQYPMDKALLAAAKASGIDRSELKNFRDNLSRNNLSDFAKENYDKLLAEFKIYTAPELFLALARVRGFVK